MTRAGRTGPYLVRRMNLGKVADEEVAQADEKGNDANGDGVLGARIVAIFIVAAVGHDGEDDKAGELEIFKQGGR